MPVRTEISMLPSRREPALKASSTTSPFASVVANAASPALSARIASAEDREMRFGFGRGRAAMSGTMTQLGARVHMIDDYDIFVRYVDSRVEDTARPSIEDRTGHAWRGWGMVERREGMRQDALAQREADQLDVGADAELVFDERVEIG